ncbi:YecH family metal-binding protein [Shewanella sp. YIC-542]|uniref:YecH family metal-binding protein n=1 Tax=Shewanella mytili TaxID=3377111 RepID=UPI00398F30B9
MNDSVHGHDVLALLLEYPQGISLPDLLTAMAKHFGANARYHTCSAQDMTAEALVTFLAKKGKFVETGKGITTDSSLICQH